MRLGVRNRHAGDVNEERKKRASDDPIGAAAGSLKGRIPSSEVIRARAREDERRAIERREHQVHPELPRGDDEEEEADKPPDVREREELEKPRTPRKTIRAPARLSGVDVRDEDAAELLRVLIEEARLLREQMTALLEAILRKLEDIEQTQSS